MSQGSCEVANLQRCQKKLPLKKPHTQDATRHLSLHPGLWCPVCNTKPGWWNQKRTHSHPFILVPLNDTHQERLVSLRTICKEKNSIMSPVRSDRRSYWITMITPKDTLIFPPQPSALLGIADGAQGSEPYRRAIEMVMAHIVKQPNFGCK